MVYLLVLSLLYAAWAHVAYLGAVHYAQRVASEVWKGHTAANLNDWDAADLHFEAAVGLAAQVRESGRIPTLWRNLTRFLGAPVTWWKSATTRLSQWLMSRPKHSAKG